MRIIYGLLIIVIVTVLLPVKSYSQTAQLVCMPDTSYVEATETFFIEIEVDEFATGLHCFNISIDFDTSLVNLISVEEGSLIDDSGQPSYFFSDSLDASLIIGNCLLGYGLHVNGPGSIVRLQLESKLISGTTEVLIGISDFSDTSVVPNQIPVLAVNGLITVESTTCCGLFTDGFTGNTNCDDQGLRDLADITRLIDRVYISKVELCCESSGNINGDSEGLLDLADITRLIDNVYISKAETSACL